MTLPNTNTDDDRQLLANAIQALTAAAKLLSGPDFAEFVTLAVAAAVANVGGVEAALARRPGSWEATHVRDMVRSTVGEDLAGLLEHRTEPVRIVVRPDETLSDIGYWRLYTEDEAELHQRHVGIGLPAITRQLDGSATGDPTPWTEVHQASADAISKLYDQVADLQADDIADYGSALSLAVHAAAASLFPGLSVPVEVTVDLDWDHEADPDDELTWTIMVEAIPSAPLPSSGIAPRDYPPGIDIGVAERHAGRGPLARIAAMADAGE